VKNVAKLALFLSFSFVGILGCTVLLSLLEEWTGLALFFPPDTDIVEVFPGKITAYLAASLPAAFYLSILLGLSYGVRRRMFYPAALAVVLIFVLGLSCGGFLGLEYLNRTEFSLAVKPPPPKLAKPGLILNAGSPLIGNQMVFLEDPYKPGGARVVFSYNKALSYQEEGAPPSRVRLPFFAEKRGIFHSISRDFERSSQIFSGRFETGPVSYCIYAGSLGAFLISLGCMVNISFWSLANLFFGALAFRGVLALESFLNQDDIHRHLASFAGKVVSEPLINPAIFCFLTLLIFLYSGLIYLSRGKVGDG
jgi:hypothetical protein